MEVWHNSSTSLQLWLFVSPLVSSWISQLVGCNLRSVFVVSETVVDSEVESV